MKKLLLFPSLMLLFVTDAWAHEEEGEINLTCTCKQFLPGPVIMKGAKLNRSHYTCELLKLTPTSIIIDLENKKLINGAISFDLRIKENKYLGTLSYLNTFIELDRVSKVLKIDKYAVDKYIEPKEREIFYLGSKYYQFLRESVLYQCRETDKI